MCCHNARNKFFRNLENLIIDDLNLFVVWIRYSKENNLESM